MLATQAAGEVWSWLHMGALAAATGAFFLMRRWVRARRHQPPEAIDTLKMGAFTTTSGVNESALDRELGASWLGFATPPSRADNGPVWPPTPEAWEHALQRALHGECSKICPCFCHVIEQPPHATLMCIRCAGLTLRLLRAAVESEGAHAENTETGHPLPDLAEEPSTGPEPKKGVD